MCGRFSLSVSREKIEEQFGQLRIDHELRDSYNIAPTQHAYVITNDQPERLQYLTWGLIPYWSNDGKNRGTLINARKEGINAKPSFRIPIRQRRCLVLADSFYEWRTDGKRKLPYRILLKDKSLMVMAGVWDMWYNGDYAMKSFSIITTPANADVNMVHNRMPVFLLDKETQSRYLDEPDLGEVLGMLRTIPEGNLYMYRVSETLNSPKFNVPSLHDLVEEPPTLF